MDTKTFRAPNLLAALQTIQKEMGPQAVVLSMRKIPGGPAWQVWKKTGYEVIASLPDQNNLGGSAAGTENQAGKLIQTTVKSSQAAAVTTRSAQIVTKPAFDGKQTTPWLVKDFAFQENEKPANKPELSPASKKAESLVTEDQSELGKASRQLLAQGVNENIISRISNVCVQTLSPAALRDEQRLRIHLFKQLEVSIHAHQKMSVGYGQVICLVGCTGSGKTSACAKLAAYYTLVEKKSVVWIGADTVKAAALSEARIYAESLGIQFEPVYTPEELELAVSQPGVDLFLVDLPGINPRSEKNLVDLGSFVTQLKRRMMYLVISATTKEADLYQAAAAFRIFNLDGLVVTRLDETSTLGNVYNFAFQSRLPLAWFSKGSNILEDLLPGNSARLVNALFENGDI
jgi:flagellar biosynthesis protein FlhF